MNPDDSNNSDLALTPERVGNLDDGSGNVGRIRHILFGNQMRDYDSRFQRLEERLAKEAADLRADVQKRLEDFEIFMRGEVESLTGRLRNEHNDRASAQEKLARDLADAGRDLSGKMSQLDEQIAGSLRDLRQRMLDQARALSSEIKEKHEQVHSTLSNEAGQIRGAMTGRESLAEMLTEVALRLKGEFHVPGAS